MSRYRIAVNVEWTAACNARCVMCPREVMARPRHMSLETYRQVLSRLHPKDVFRAVVAGYGDPTLHPRFDDFLAATHAAAVPVDMVTNGERLDAARLRALDGVLHTLTVSFSSIVPEVYRRVHVGLDQARVMENLRTAQDLLRHTRLVVSLTPLADCIATLDQTVAWLHGHGIHRLSMSPSIYNRAGTMDTDDPAAPRLRQVIRRYRLHNQELDFVGSLGDVIGQWRANRFRCLPRNSDLAIAADGNYQYCFNDVRRIHPLGHVANLSVREILALRERTAADPRLCDTCSSRTRYRPAEFLQAAAGYGRLKLAELGGSKS